LAKLAKLGRRIGMAFSIAVVIGGVLYLSLGKFSENLVYFVTPSEVVAFSPEQYGRRVRVAGMVVKESVKVVPNTLVIHFKLTDGIDTIPVVFEGIPPDLFKEGQGAVAEGYWRDDKQFHSSTIMAKHSEDYMPVDMKNVGVSLPKKDFLKTLNIN